MSMTGKPPIPYIPYDGMLLFQYLLASGFLTSGPCWDRVCPAPRLGLQGKEALRLLMAADALVPGPQWAVLVEKNPDLGRLGQGDLRSVFTE